MVKSEDVLAPAILVSSGVGPTILAGIGITTRLGE